MSQFFLTMNENEKSLISEKVRDREISMKFLAQRVCTESSGTFGQKLFSCYFWVAILNFCVSAKNAYIPKRGKISTKVLAHRVFAESFGTLSRKHFPAIFCRQFQFLHKWKNVKQSKIVILAKSLMLFGMLFFCCANTISFSLAKQCSIMFCHLQMLYFEYFVGSLVEFSTLSKYRKWPDMTSLIDFLFWRKIYRYCILHCKY